MHQTCRVGLTLAATFLTTGCGSAGAAWSRPPAGWTQAQIVLGEEFVLRVGQTAVLRGAAGPRVGFTAVREDSRCPAGATCVWAGDAVVAIAVTTAGENTRTIELHTNADFETEAALDGHRIRLIELAPMPREGSTIDGDQYEATLVINRSAA